MQEILHYMENGRDYHYWWCNFQIHCLSKNVCYMSASTMLSLMSMNLTTYSAISYILSIKLIVNENAFYISKQPYRQQRWWNYQSGSISRSILLKNQCLIRKFWTCSTEAWHFDKSPNSYSWRLQNRWNWRVCLCLLQRIILLRCVSFLNIHNKYATILQIIISFSTAYI